MAHGGLGERVGLRIDAREQIGHRERAAAAQFAPAVDELLAEIWFAHQRHDPVWLVAVVAPAAVVAVLVLPAHRVAVVEAAAGPHDEVVVPKRSLVQLAAAVLVHVVTAHVGVLVAAELGDDDHVHERIDVDKRGVAGQRVVVRDAGVVRAGATRPVQGGDEVIIVLAEVVALLGGGCLWLEDFDGAPAGGARSVVGDPGRFEAGQVAAGDLRRAVVRRPHRGDVGAVLALLDLFEEHVDADVLARGQVATVGAEEHLEVLGARRFDADLAAEFERQRVAYQRLISPRAVEHPVGLGRQPEQRVVEIDVALVA